MNVQSVRVGLLPICASIMLMISSSMGAIAKDGDRGPTVTITGAPAPPCIVHSELDRLYEDGHIETIRPGDDVAVTVSSTAQGTSRLTNRPNQVAELSLWAIKYYPGPPPQIGEGGTFFQDGSPDEAPHTGQCVTDFPDIEGEHQEGLPLWGPSFSDNGGVSHSWVFKWSTGAMAPATNASHTWTLHFYYGPGYYWYSGEAQDVWSEEGHQGGGFSFWSPVLGSYQSVD